jgi:hypothetical protein
MVELSELETRIPVLVPWYLILQKIELHICAARRKPNSGTKKTLKGIGSGWVVPVDQRSAERSSDGIMSRATKGPLFQDLTCRV